MLPPLAARVCSCCASESLTAPAAAARLQPERPVCIVNSPSAFGCRNPVPNCSSMHTFQVSRSCEHVEFMPTPRVATAEAAFWKASHAATLTCCLPEGNSSTGEATVLLCGPRVVWCSVGHVWAAGAGACQPAQEGLQMFARKPYHPGCFLDGDVNVSECLVWPPQAFWPPAVVCPPAVVWPPAAGPSTCQPTHSPSCFFALPNTTAYSVANCLDGRPR
jgi:hypothetical protein